MGMYDHIQCKYPLPVPPMGWLELSDIDWKTVVFQTKSLENGLDSYEIREDGTFWHILPLPFYLANYTGTIIFYESIQRNTNRFDYWIEYRVVIVDGKLHKIDLIKFESKANKKRKDIESKWTDYWSKQDAFFNKWYIKYTYVPYRNAVRKMFRTWRRFASKFPASHKIENKLLPL